MPLMWRAQLSVGNEAIDADHRHLIEILNRAESSISGGSPMELSTAFTNLARYAREHFEREESIALAAGYDLVKELKQSHVVWMQKLEHLSSEVGTNGQKWPAPKIEHFKQLLHSWMIDHVIKEDLRMKPYLERFPPSFKP